VRRLGACLFVCAPQHVQTIMRLERALRVYEEEKEIEQAPPLTAADSVPMHRRLRTRHHNCVQCVHLHADRSVRVCAWPLWHTVAAGMPRRRQVWA
jgi:hypothetical protein